jgi:hypothetical protein
VRRSKEIMVLLALLIGAMAFVLWYVIDRRAKMHALPAVVTKPAEPASPAKPAMVAAPTEPVDLTKHDGQTIDFSSGKPVVKDSPGDKAELEKVAKELEEAAKEVTFGPPVKKKEPEPTPVPPKN